MKCFWGCRSVTALFLGRGNRYETFISCSIFLFFLLIFGVNEGRSATQTWDAGGGAGATNWSTGTNWNPDGAPVFSAGDTFNLNNINIVAGSTSTMDTSNTLGTIIIGDTNATQSWNLAGAGTLTLNGNGAAAAINQSSASLGDTISIGTINLTGDLNLNNSSATNARRLTISSNISSSAATGTQTISNVGTTLGSMTLSGIISDGVTGGQVALVHNNTVGTNLETLTLSGANTYTGTTTVTKGLLNVNNNSALGSTAGGTTVASGGAINLLNGIQVTGETITISATHSNNAGALQANAAASATWAGNVILVSGASSRIGAQAAGTLTVSGAITEQTAGTSLFVSGLSGTGTVILTAAAGSNTYTGLTSLVRGNLKGGATNALAQNSVIDVGSSTAVDQSTLDLNGFDQTIGGLKHSGNTAGGNATVTNSGALKTLTVNQSTDTSFGDTTLTTGAITGALALTKTGSGILTLTGTNTATGQATVNGGTLVIGTASGGSWASGVDVNSGGTLKGRGAISGAVTVNSGGTYSPGNSPGIQSVGSLTLNSGSTTVIEIDGLTAGNGSGFHDQIQVTGAAVINGGTLSAQTIFSGSSGFVPAAGTKFTVITASSLTGTFSQIDSASNPSNISFLPEYTSTAVNLYVTPGRTWSEITGLTGNQQAVGRGLEGFRSVGISSSTDAGKINQALFGKNSSELSAAFEEMNPERLSAMRQTALSTSRIMSSMVEGRFQEIRSGSTGWSLNGMAIQDQRGDSFYEPLAMEGERPLLVRRKKSPEKWDFFINGSGLFEEIEASENRTGIQSKTGASLVGIDYRLTEKVTFGAVMGQSYVTSDFSNRVGKTESNGGSTGAFLNYRTGGYYANSYVGGTFRTYDTERKISFLNERAKGSTEGRELNASVTTGFDFQYQKLVFGPTAKFGFDRVWIDGFEERGSIAQLKLEDQINDSVRSNIGIRVAYPLQVASRKIIPLLNMGWEHEYQNTNEIRARFLAGGDSFSVQSNPIGQDTFVLENAYTIELSKSIDLTIGYQARLLTQDYIAHGVNVGLRFGF